jgi:hypothetical protein
MERQLDEDLNLVRAEHAGRSLSDWIDTPA